jgi:hypothetical protein
MKGILLRWLARYDAWCQEWGLTPRTGAAARRYAMMKTRSARRRATTSLELAGHGASDAVVVER